MSSKVLFTEAISVNPEYTVGAGPVAVDEYAMAISPS